MKGAKKKFQSAKETAGASSVFEHRENAAFGPLRREAAFKCVWALLLARRDGSPYPAHRLKDIGDAICMGNKGYLAALQDAIDFFSDATIHDGRIRVADPLRYYLAEFLRAWESFFLGERKPSLRDIKDYLNIQRVAVVRDDTLRRIWKDELNGDLVGAGRARQSAESSRQRERFFTLEKEKRATGKAKQPRVK